MIFCWPNHKVGNRSILIEMVFTLGKLYYEAENLDKCQHYLLLYCRLITEIIISEHTNPFSNNVLDEYNQDSDFAAKKPKSIGYNYDEDANYQTVMDIEAEECTHIKDVEYAWLIRDDSQWRKLHDYSGLTDAKLLKKTMFNKYVYVCA